jgi:hypothetical protein
MTMTMTEFEIEWSELIGVLALAFVYESREAVERSISMVSDNLHASHPVFDRQTIEAIVTGVLKRTRQIERTAARGSAALN